MLKKIGAKYVIIGHSENRANGETNVLINRKIISSTNNGLKIIFCIGETLMEKKKKHTKKVLKKQIMTGLKKVKKLKNILFAYEPVWSIGTGIIPKNQELENNVEFIKHNLKRNFKIKNPIVLYGGSVNPKNINKLKIVSSIDGFLIGGASQKSKKFIDIVKKTFN